MRWHSLVAGLAVGLSLLLLPAPARAQAGGAVDEDRSPLARARAHVAAVELNLARDALDEALRSGASGPAELAEIYLLSGRVEATLGNAGEARAQFRRLLAVDPAARLPDGLAPKIVAPFEAARKSARAPLRLRAELREGAEPALVVIVRSDPVDMVAGVRAVVSAADSGDQTVAVALAGRRDMTVRLPRGGAARIALSVVDVHGNRLAEAAFAGDSGKGDARLSAIVVPAPESPMPPAGSPPPQEHPSTPILARWYLWAGVSVVMAAGGTYFALAAKDTGDELDEWSRESGMHDASDALELDARGRRQTIFADVGFAAAVVSGGVAGWLLWRSMRDESSPVVSAAVDDDGGAVSLHLRF